jgi:NHL repeat
MNSDLSARSGRMLSNGSTLPATFLWAAGVVLSGCGGGGNNRTDASLDGGGGDRGVVELQDGSNESDTANVADAKKNTDADVESRGNGQIGTITKAANDTSFKSPFDATPSPDGSMIYFTAVGADGTGGVFSVRAGGGAATRLDSGGLLVSPSGITISADSNQLYVADAAADDDMTDSYGAIFVLPASGGTPAAVSGTKGLQPRGLVVSGSSLYFTGVDISRGGPGVYSIAASGGQPNTIASGAPFLNPSGIAVAQNGDVYVADSLASASQLAAVIKVSNGHAMPIVSDLGVGYPAGIALVQDESALLVSGIDPLKQTDLVYRIELGATPTLSSFDQTISAFGESAGLHRAAGADIYAWADSLANGTGTVFALSK